MAFDDQGTNLGEGAAKMVLGEEGGYEQFVSNAPIASGACNNSRSTV